MAITELSMVDKAKDLAMDTHIGQTRKVSNKPYYLHPFRVFQRSKAMKYNKDIQLICLLHDVMEDSKNKKYTEDKIKSTFGNTIFKFIKLLSHDKAVDYNRYVLEIAKRSKTALVVKLIDMIENLLDNPSNKQIIKYTTAIKYLIDNKINIDNKLLNMFKKFKID